MNLLIISLPISILSMQSDVGACFFYLTGISLFISCLGFLVTLLTRLIAKDNSYKLPLRISLISLLVSGVSLLLTSILCGWV